MLKIDIEPQGSTIARVRLTGKLSGDHLPELARLVDGALESGRRVGFDLDAVTLADRAAVAFLASRTTRGIGIERCPGFLREWIRREVEQREGASPFATVSEPSTKLRGLGSREATPERQGARS